MITFEQIADTEKELAGISARVRDSLSRLNTNVSTQQPQRVTFLNGSVVQWRQKFWVSKKRPTTWNDVYKAVNDVRPVAYTKVK